MIPTAPRTRREPRAGRRRPLQQRGCGRTRLPTPERCAGAATARARRARRDAHALVRELLAGKLDDRELAPQDYDRLADAILRLQAAVGVLRTAGDSAAGDAARLEQREVLIASLAEIETITGVPPSQLGRLLAPGGHATAPEPDAPEHGR